MRKGGAAQSTRWRIRYAKERTLRFASHLEIVRAIVRAVSMSGLPVAYTQGFNPRPRLSFGPPLPVGVTGEGELFEIELTRSVGEGEIVSAFDRGLLRGLRVISASRLSSKLSASALTEAAEYVVRDIPVIGGLPAGEIEERIAALRGTREARVPRGDSVRTVSPSEQILELELVKDEPVALRLVLAVGKPGAMRPFDVVRLLCGSEDVAPELARVHRVKLLRRAMNGAGGLETIC